MSRPEPIDGSPCRSPGDPSARLDALAQDLADVEVALQRLDEGTYESCEACGAPLPPAVLVAFPAARRCGEHGGPGRTGGPP